MPDTRCAVCRQAVTTTGMVRGFGDELVHATCWVTPPTARRSIPAMWRMKRLAVAILVFLAAPLAVEAQQAGKISRLGILTPAAPPDPSESAGATLILAALRPLGDVEGGNLVVGRRFAESKPDRLPGLARELLQLRVDVTSRAPR